MRVLVIEDDRILSSAIIEMLKSSRYQVDLAESIKDAIYFAKTYSFDLILLQYLAGVSLDFIKQVQSLSPKTSIIVISSIYEKEFELRSLQAGAIDFLTQPLDLEILLARIQAHLRLHTERMIQVGDLCILPSQESATFKGKILNLKGKPFEVLSYLAMHHDRIVSKEELLDSIWEEPKLVTPNVIEVIINHIRQKLDKPFGIQSIQTIRKRGYRLTLQTQSIPAP